MSKRDGNNDESEQDRERRLADAYEHMLERVREHYEKPSPESETSGLQQALDWARERAVDLGELTRDEARIIGVFLWRDLEDAGTYLARSGRDMRDWLQFDLEFLETRFKDLLLSVADQTQLEWMAFKRNQTLPSTYYTGEMAGAGTLVCDACGARMQFSRPARIPPCPKCASTEFHRRAV